MPLERVRITVEHSGQVITAMFNPEEYSLNKDNNFASQAIPGLSSPLLQFVNGGLRTLEMELFFDTSVERTDVRDRTNQIADLLKIDSDLHAPPVLNVAWGSLQLRCVLSRLSQKFIKFIETGAPVRARLNATFQEFTDPEREASAVNRQTADFTKIHTVGYGDTLSNIANRYYQDPALWRPIAVANDLDDPRAIDAGQQLTIPALPFIDPISGEVVA